MIVGTGDGTNSYINSTATTLSQSVSDASPLQMRFDNDNSAWPAYESYAATKSWTLSTGDGTKYVYYQFVDAAGNSTTVGSTARDSIVLDTVSPTLAPILGTGPGTITNDTTPSWTWIATSGSGGNGLFSTRMGGGSYGSISASTAYTSFALPEGSFIFRVREHDYAGNFGPELTYTVQIDITPPVAPSVSHSADPFIAGQTTDSTVTWTWAPGGGGSGIYRYDFNDSTPDTVTTQTSATATADGLQTLYVQERDAAGNWSSVSIGSVRLTPIIPYNGAGDVSRSTNIYWRAVAAVDSYRLEAYDPGLKTWVTLYEGTALFFDPPSSLKASTTFQVRVSSFYKLTWTIRWSSTFTTGL